MMKKQEKDCTHSDMEQDMSMDKDMPKEKDMKKPAKKPPRMMAFRVATPPKK